MESHFGWLAVNHLSNVSHLLIKGVEQVDGAGNEEGGNERIEQASVSQKGKTDISQTEQTIGSLDLGGASLEIAFLSNESTLVTRSFSSLGADQLRRPSSPTTEEGASRQPSMLSRWLRGVV